MGRGAGDDTFILGCGLPIAQGAGVVDGMRIGPDVAPFWDPSTASRGRLDTRIDRLDVRLDRPEEQYIRHLEAHATH